MRSVLRKGDVSPVFVSLANHHLMASNTHPDPQVCTILYKILTPVERQTLPSKNWEGTKLDLQDGFIHLSTSHQVPGTLERFFGIDSGVGDSLVLMALPRVHISDPNSLKFEPAAGTLFGHIYGSIDPDVAFVHEYTLQRGSDGQFQLQELPF